MTLDAERPEPWLRGTLSKVDALRRQVLHALELADEDVTRWCEQLTDAEMHSRPFGIASIAYQVRHIGRSLDRLLTYAEGHQLSIGQLSALASELEDSLTKAELLAEFRVRLEDARQRVMAMSPETFEEIRGVGRKMLPTTVGSLLVHTAEHTQPSRWAGGDDSGRCFWESETIKRAPRRAARSFSDVGSDGAKSGLDRRSTYQVAHLIAFRLEIMSIVRGLRDLSRNTLDYANAGLFKSLNLLRIIRNEADRGNVKLPENLCRQLKDPAVGFETEFKVRLDCVTALVLELVGAKLGHQSNTTTLLLFVEQHTGTRSGDRGESKLKLLATVATQRVEDVASQALRMNANNRRSGVDVTHDESDGRIRRGELERAGPGYTIQDCRQLLQSRECESGPNAWGSRHPQLW